MTNLFRINFLFDDDEKKSVLIYPVIITLFRAFIA